MLYSALCTAANRVVLRVRDHGRASAAGAACGLALLAWSAQFIATFGLSLTAQSAMLVATVVGLLLGLSPLARRVPTAALHFLIAAWTAAFPWILTLGLQAISVMSIETLATPSIALGILIGIAAFCLTLPIAAIGQLLQSAGSHASGAASRTALSRAMIFTMAAVLVVVPMTPAPAWGAHVCGLLGALIGIVLLVDELRRSSDVRPAAGFIPATGSAGVALTAGHWTVRRWQGVAVALCVGAGCAAVTRITAQLLLDSAFLFYAEWAGWLAGLGVGLSRQNGGPPAARIARSALLCGCAVALPVLFFPNLVRGSLWLSARVSDLWLILPLRVLLAAGMLAPLGLVFGRLVKSHPRSETAIRSCWIAAAVGWLAMRWLLPQPGVAAAVVGIASLLVAAPSVLQPGGTGIGVWLQRLTSAAATVMLLCAPFFTDRYDPRYSAQRLFSTQSFAAFNSGVEDALIPVLDDAREIASISGREGTWTLWKQRGHQLSLRENGVPHALLSVNPALCPQSSSELCAAVAPLALHPQPRQVLWFGLGGAAGVAAGLAFPVESLTCVEADADLIALVNAHVRPRLAVDALADERFRLLNVDPALAAATRNIERYDVIVLNDSIAALFSNAPQFTREHYGRLAGKLAKGGILCQRFQYMDLGPGPIEQMTQTLRDVFPQVVLLETAPGELLFLATASTEPLVRESMLARFQTPHVRRLLSQLGWDWSIVFRLRAVSAEKSGALAGAHHESPNTTANDAFAFRLPREVMRWGAKWQDVQKLLAEHSQLWIHQLEETADFEELSQRLADVNRQQQLFQDHPDHFWAYRKSLKERLTDRPRSKIITVAHQGLKRGLHPEDQRRKDYLVALGRAATQEHPSLASIARVQQFVEPYDPLLSYFVHQEAAYLLERSEPRDPERELAHRLHAVYYATPTDRSVRQIVASLELLIEAPAAVPDPVQRWDEMNGLLEILKQRWVLRTNMPAARSRFEPVDTDKSIEIAKRTLDHMEALAPQAGVDAATWAARRTVLERYLVRPLQTYRSSQRKQYPIATAAQPHRNQ